MFFCKVLMLVTLINNAVGITPDWIMNGAIYQPPRRLNDYDPNSCLQNLPYGANTIHIQCNTNTGTLSFSTTSVWVCDRGFCAIIQFRRSSSFNYFCTSYTHVATSNCQGGYNNTRTSVLSLPPDNFMCGDNSDHLFVIHRFGASNFPETWDFEEGDALACELFEGGVCYIGSLEISDSKTGRLKGVSMSNVYFGMPVYRSIDGRFYLLGFVVGTWIDVIEVQSANWILHNTIDVVEIQPHDPLSTLSECLDCHPTNAPSIP